MCHVNVCLKKRKSLAQIIDAGATELYKETLAAGGNVSMVVEAASHPRQGAGDIYGELEACERHSELYFGPSTKIAPVFIMSLNDTSKHTIIPIHSVWITLKINFWI